MTTEYKFKKKWDENTNTDWWNASRIELNKIIDAYNNWQMEDDFDKGKSKLVLAKIEYGKQTIGSQDGGSGYLEELDEMETFVREKLSENAKKCCNVMCDKEAKDGSVYCDFHVTL
jgi:hypothetical protein